MAAPGRRNGKRAGNQSGKAALENESFEKTFAKNARSTLHFSASGTLLILSSIFFYDKFFDTEISMKTLHRNACLACADFASYMNGTAYEKDKESIEQHLSDCDFCFETLISMLNVHLDNTNLPTGSENGASRAYQFA
jgi:hypothetical protein